ncbi:MAG: molybdopterin-dependent oxidoreductase [Actinobacteria bacterium]|nr:molybdopterin-dependent oxidoreductase [Actinomycetota bacterium]
MAGRRTNIALLWLLAAAFLTGTLAFAIGVGWGRWIVLAHGVAGFAIVALAPWKSMIAGRGLRRRRPGRSASVAFSILVVVALMFGVLHASGAPQILGITAMQVHVGAALLAIPLFVSHVKARRSRAHTTDLTRRNALRAGALLGGAGALYAVAEGSVRLARLPGAGRRFTGSLETGSWRPEAMPITQWLDDDVPSIRTHDWRLTVRSDRGEREWTYEELHDFHDVLEATLDCTGGWYAAQRWEGAWLSRLLDGPQTGASVVVTSATGYSRRFPVGEAGRLLVATRVGDHPLSAGHGFPLRIVAPGRRGFWWVKWVRAIEVSGAPWWAQPPFPLT